MKSSPGSSSALNVFQMIGFAPGPTTTLSAFHSGVDPRKRLAYSAIASRSDEQPARRRVVRVVVVERVDRGLLDMLGRVEVGFADLHVHDAAPARFELARAR